MTRRARAVGSPWEELVQTRLTREASERLCDLAAARGESVAALLRQIIVDAVDLPAWEDRKRRARALPVDSAAPLFERVVVALCGTVGSEAAMLADEKAPEGGARRVVRFAAAVVAEVLDFNANLAKVGAK